MASSTTTTKAVKTVANVPWWAYLAFGAGLLVAAGSPTWRTPVILFLVAIGLYQFFGKKSS